MEQVSQSEEYWKELILHFFELPSEEKLKQMWYEEIATFVDTQFEQMSDEKRATRIKLFLKRASDQETGSYIKSNIEFLAAGVKLGVEHLTVMKPFSDEEIVENSNQDFKQMSDEQLGKIAKNYFENSSKEDVAEFFKLSRAYMAIE